MPIDASAIGIRPVTPERPSREPESVQRREEGTVAGFRPQTNVALRTAISDLAGTLERIATSEKLGMEKIPTDIHKMIRNILEQSLSLKETLGKGIGSTIESQRFSMEQLSTFGRMLFQLGSLADKGFLMKISPETQTLLTQFKNLISHQEGGNALEPVLMTKSSFELLDSKIPEQLPQVMYEILSQLAQPLAAQSNQPQQESDIMNFLNKLVKFFMPRPESDNRPPTPQNQQQPINQGQPQQNFQQPMYRGQTFQQNFQQPFNQNQPQQNFQQPFNQNQPQNNFQQPFNQNQPQNNFQQPMNQNQPQNNFQQPFNQNQPQNNFQQPMNQGQPQNNFQQPMNQGQPQNNFQQPFNQNQPQNNFQQPMNQNQPQNNFQQPFNQEQPQQQMSPEEFIAQQQDIRKQMNLARLQMLRQPMLNDHRTVDTMKSLAKFLMQNTEMTQQDQANLQKFVNNPQQTLSRDEVRHLQNLMRLCQQNVPATVRQASIQQNLPDLPRLWAFMQMCDMAQITSSPMKGREFRRAGKDVGDFANSMRKAMSGENFTSNVQTQRSFQMMVPIYLNVNEMSYPTYLNVYDEKNHDNETGKDKKETWLRICVLTDNIGAAELIFRVYEENQLDMRFYFSQGETAGVFATYVDEIREAMQGINLQLGEIRIGSIGATMEQY